MDKNEDTSNKKSNKINGKFLSDAVKKGAAISIIPFVTVTCAACNNTNPTIQNQDSTQQNQSPTFEEIPYATQTKNYEYAMDYPADFFSSKANYFNIGGGRYVDLIEYTQVYVYYEKGLDSKIVDEIKRAAEYFESVLHPINTGYRITVQEGEPKKISQYFCKDSIYFRKMTSERYQQMNGDFPISGMTVKTNLKPPQIYINTEFADRVIVDGKHIELNQVVLHEMLHGFGLNHTSSNDDIMYTSGKNYVQDSRGKWMVDKFTSKEYVTDYEKFSDNEIRALIYNFCHAKKLEINAEIYHIINNFKTHYSKYEFQERCDRYLENNFEKIKNSVVGERIESNQIICIKQANRDKRIILNADYLGMYKIVEKGKVTSKGQYLLIDSEKDGVTLQTIVLAKSPVCSENVQNSTFIRPNRQSFGPDKTYFSGYNNQLYFDDTANWLKENNIEQSERPVYLAAMLGINFDNGEIKEM